MNSYIITIIIFIVINCIKTQAQEKIWLKQSKIAEVIAFEKSLSPDIKFLQKNVFLGNDYYPLANVYNVTQPIIVQRPAVGYLPVYAEYFYTPTDSVVRLISYDWEIDRYGNFFDKQKIWKEESSKLGTYNKEYERIRDISIAQLGTPTVTDTTAKIIHNGETKYFTRATSWETKEISASLEMIFHANTYRVRFKLYWKK